MVPHFARADNDKIRAANESSALKMNIIVILSYHNTEFRSVRKQNCVFDSLIEMNVLVNGHTLW